MNNIFASNSEDKYMRGLGNHFFSEAESNALPLDQNSPQKVNKGLYSEQLSGTPFMVSRAENRHTWLYKIRPSVGNYIFKPKSHATLLGRPFKKTASPNQLRWLPLPINSGKTDFIDGLYTICGNGSTDSLRGSALHIYRANIAMINRVFCDYDAEIVFVPELGALEIFTEMGEIELKPGEICVIPAGIKFKIKLVDKEIRGYLLENFGRYFRLPELGPIGANGLAYREHFLCPRAKYEHYEEQVELIVKFQDQLWSTLLEHSPLDVVAWKGNYVPYKYDLSLFQTINTVSFDHVDPSIFTVLTSPSEVSGLSNIDFTIFPPRWAVAEHTFRPPYFHRNCMNELMGLIFGKYESRSEGFLPGGLTLHNSFGPHGADLKTYEMSINVELQPQRLDQTLAFMFESSLAYQPTQQALDSDFLDVKYASIWQGYKAQFKK